MDGAAGLQARLECLKLAVQLEGRHGVENVKLCADTLWSWLTYNMQQEPVQTPKKGK